MSERLNFLFLSNVCLHHQNNIRTQSKGSHKSTNIEINKFKKLSSHIDPLTMNGISIRDLNDPFKTKEV